MKEEMIDIYNDKGVHIGIEKKSLLKKKGYWHNTFQCWVILELNDEKYILFQKRHHTKKFNPNKLATSAGGHIMAGESIEEGIRELNEELGINPGIDRLEYLGIYKEIRKTEKENNKEKQHIYLYTTSDQLESFTFQLEELSGLYKMKLVDFDLLVNQITNTVNVSGIEWIGDSYETKEWEVSLEDIVGAGTDFLKFSLDKIKDNL